MSEFAVPGKLFIAGEYGVVTPGCPAVLTAVEHKIRARVTLDSETRDTAVSGTVSVHSAHFGNAPCFWHPLSQTEELFDPSREPVLRALDVVSELWEGQQGLQLPGMRIDIESSLVNAAGMKFGFGSSGAVVVAVIGAVGQALSIDIDDDMLFRLSALAVIAGDERASCADVAVAVLGGWVWYRSFDRTRTNKIRSRDGVKRAMSEGFEGVELRVLPRLPESSIVVGHTGKEASTRQLVANMDASIAAGRYDLQAFNERNAHAVTAFASACELGDVHAACVAMREVRGTLDELDANAGFDGAPLGIVTPELAHMVTLAESAGAVAKFSGAGGGDCAIALAPSVYVGHAVQEAWSSAGYSVIPIEPGDDKASAEEENR